MSRQKKVKIFMVVVVVLYIVATSYGLTRDDGAMGAAMEVVNEKVESAREKIQEEMDKPFILRLFGSLFSMEGNTLENLKKDLPEILKGAMPDILASETKPAPAEELACVGMRLPEALEYLAKKEDAELGEVRWSFDSKVVEERYIQLGGTVLEAEWGEPGEVVLVIQFPHDFDGEEGLGESPSDRKENLEQLESEALEARYGEWRLCDWLAREDPEEVDQAVEEGFQIDEWCPATVAHASALAIPETLGN